MGAAAKTSQALTQRGRIVLAYADGASVTAAAADLRVLRDTVRKWRGRFLASRLEGLADELQPGARRKITDEQVELVIPRTWRNGALVRTRTGPPAPWPLQPECRGRRSCGSGGPSA